MAKQARVHYVDNKRLYDEMVQFITAYRLAEKNGTDKPRIPEYVGECILKIAQRLSLRPNFIGYTYRDEMVGDGIENVLTYIHNYDPEKANPFAYFTQIIYFAFLRRLDKEKKQSYIKHKMLEQSSLMNLLADMPGGETNDDSHSVTVMTNVDGRLNDLVNKFEKKGVKSKKKRGVEKFESEDPPFLDPHPDEEKKESA